MNVYRNNRPQGNSETSVGCFGLPQRLSVRMGVYVCVCVHVHTLLLVEYLWGRHVESPNYPGCPPKALGLKRFSREESRRGRDALNNDLRNEKGQQTSAKGV